MLHCHGAFAGAGHAVGRNDAHAQRVRNRPIDHGVPRTRVDDERKRARFIPGDVDGNRH